MENKYITMIGSRTTPPDIIEIMELFAEAYSAMGYIFRSGGAMGADDEVTRMVPPENREIYLPWDGFNGLNHNGRDLLKWNFSSRKADATATAQHVRVLQDAPPLVKQSLINFHSRNMMQVLGYELDKPSGMVICWTPDGLPIGGTASAITLAHAMQIPVMNLGDQEQMLEIIKGLEER